MANCVEAFYGSDPKASPDFARLVNPRHHGRVARFLKDGRTAFGGETDALMPFPIHYAHRILEALAAARKSGRFSFLYPDSKSQLTVEYDETGAPRRVHTVVISTQHGPAVHQEEITSTVIDRVIRPVVPAV